MIKLLKPGNVMNLRILQLSLMVCLVVVTSCAQVVTSPVPPLPPSTETHQLSPSTPQPDTTFTPLAPLSPTPLPSREELIVFAARAEQTTIGLITSAGQNQRGLTDAIGNDFLPKWSPDGQYIAYLSDRQVPLDKNNEQFYDLWLFDLANGHSTRLTREGQVDSHLTAFVWSPNGNKIMYDALSIRVEVIELKSQSIDIVGDHFNSPFAWSKQGEIAVTDRFTEPMAIFSLAILNSDYNPILPPEVGFTAGSGYPLNTATSLAWRPDGKQLAIGSYFAGKGDSDLKLVAVVKDKVVDQASLAEKFSVIQESEVTDVTWSPNGERLAFRLIKEDNEQIYVTNSELTELAALTPADKQCNYPQWSPDSTHLVFSCRTKDDNSDLWLVKADGSDLHPLTNTPTISEETPMWQPLSQ